MKLTNLLPRLAAKKPCPQDLVWEEHSIHLERGLASSFGFAVCCDRGQEAGAGEVVVEDVVRGGPAEGRLRLGDHLVEVEGVRVEGLEYHQVIQGLRGAPHSLRLVVRRRGPGIVPLENTWVTLFRGKGKEGAASAPNS